MSILFLQSPYSFFFRDIANELKIYNIECYSLVFNLGDRYLYKGVKQIDIHKLIQIRLSEYIKPIILELTSIPNYYLKKKEKILGEELSEKEKKYFFVYTQVLEEIIKNKNIKILIMQNDTRWQHAFAISLAKKLDIKYLVFELGLFRPNTITIDEKGVNYNNLVPRNKAFYKDLYITNKFDYSKVLSDITEPKRNLIIMKYMLFYKLGEILKKNSIENKKIKLLDYCKRFLKAYIWNLGSKNPKITLPNNYIFAPFQVLDDSQTLVHSDFNNMSEFAETVIKGVKKYNSKCNTELSVIFKEHPMDIGRVNYENLYNRYKNDKNIIFLRHGDTKEIIKFSKLIITINSTVGIEALEKKKKVICLGRAFYTIDGIAFESNPNNLANDIEEVLKAKVDGKLIDNFLNYLKYEYQFPGNEYFYNPNQITNITNNIIKKLRENY